MRYEISKVIDCGNAPNATQKSLKERSPDNCGLMINHCFSSFSI